MVTLYFVSFPSDAVFEVQLLSLIQVANWVFKLYFIRSQSAMHREAVLEFIFTMVDAFVLEGLYLIHKWIQSVFVVFVL